MSFSPLINELIQSLRCLPGVGPKSAQRMAITLLEKKSQDAKHLAHIINKALDNVRRCIACRTLCESELCDICNSAHRNITQLCIVETPMDVLAIEQSGSFGGKYFVLMGRLSPLDGIGPEELKLHELEARFTEAELIEIILATNPTVEGEATAHYITQLAKKSGKQVSRIAYGVPVGGELEYVDGTTLGHSMMSRQRVL